MKITKKIATLFICLFGFAFCSCSNDSSNVPVQEFSFALSVSSIKEGETCLIMDEYIMPAHATNKRIEYWVEDSNIATIADGIIYGLKAGSTLVCGKTTDGTNIEYSVPLKVKPSNTFISSIELSFESAHSVGDVFEASVYILPKEATNKSFELVASSNIVSITNTTITCVNAGSCTIKAIAKDGSGVTSTEVTLNISNPSIKSISLSAKKTKLLVGSSSQVNVTYVPATIEDKEVIFTTKSSGIISVSETGLVTGLANGTDYVVATYKNNPSITAELKFIVSNVEPKSISINLPSNVYAGDTYDVTVTVDPLDAFTDEASFSITSGQTYASITSSGKLLVAKVGTFTIHAYLVERPSITTDLVVTSIEGMNPSDPYHDDIFAGA